MDVLVMRAQRDPKAGVEHPGPHELYRRPRLAVEARAARRRSRRAPARRDAPGRDLRHGSARDPVRSRHRLHPRIRPARDRPGGPRARSRRRRARPAGRLRGHGDPPRRLGGVRVSRNLPPLRRLPQRPLQPVSGGGAGGHAARRGLRGDRGPARTAGARRERSRGRRSRPAGRGLHRARGLQLRGALARARAAR